MYRHQLLERVRDRVWLHQDQLTEVNARRSHAASNRAAAELRVASALDSAGLLNLADQVADVELLLRQRATEERALMAKLAVIEVELGDLAVKREEVRRDLAAAWTRHWELLQENADYRRLTEGQRKAERLLYEARPNPAELIDECEDRIAEYDEISSFRYLQQRRFGEPDYAGRGIRRLFDRWVARRINYELHRATHALLIAKRDRLTAAFYEADEALVQTRDEVDKLVRKIEAESGLTRAKSALRDTEDQGLGAFRRALKVHVQLAAYGDGADPLYVQARAKLTTMLGPAWVTWMAEQPLRPVSCGDADATGRLHQLHGELRLHAVQRAELDALRDAALQRYDRARELDSALVHTPFTAGEEINCQQADLDELLDAYMSGVLGRESILRAVTQQLPA